MALKAENARHANQIAAGTEGRLKGHKFEELVSNEVKKCHRCVMKTGIHH